MTFAGEAGVVARLRAAGCVFAEDEARLLIEAAGPEPAGLDELVARRVAGEPLEFILGWAEFRGLRIAVDPGVFVPRQRTRLLVDLAVGRAAGTPHRIVAVDLCCGSGAAGAALAVALPAAEIYAADIDPAAVACARRNLAAAAGRVHQGDLYDALPLALRGRVDILLANAPYVPTGEIGMMPPEARDHEPLVALDGGPDGLDVLRRVIAGAPTWLAPGGHLYVEVSDDQASEAVRAAHAAGLRAEIATDDELDATAVIATRESAVL